MTTEPSEYVGVSLPAWAAEGVRVRVRRTPLLRRYGLRVAGGVSRHDCKAWPGEIGTIERRDGFGWYDFVIVFDRRRRVLLDAEALESVARVRNPQKPLDPEPGRDYR